MKTSSPAAALMGTILTATDGCKRDKKRAYYLVSLAAERDAVSFRQTAEKEVLSHSQSYQSKSIGVINQVGPVHCWLTNCVAARRALLFKT